jgi:tetratricopeptide (TPR) repeat protein
MIVQEERPSSTFFALPGTEIDGIVDSILADIVLQLQQLKPMTAEMLESAWPGGQGDGFQELRTVLDNFARRANDWNLALSKATTHLGTILDSTLPSDLTPDAWIESTIDKLHNRFLSEPDAAMDHWLASCATAIASWRSNWLTDLCQEPFPCPGGAGETLDLMSAGARGLVEGDYVQTLPMLSLLVDGADQTSRWVSLLEPETRLRLLMLIGRVHLYREKNHAGAERRFNQARELAPLDGRPFAALAELSRLSPSGSENALSLNASAIERSRYHIDGYLGMGLAHEQQNQWQQAESWYDKALRLVLDRELAMAETVADSLDKLLLPVSAHVFLSFGRVVIGKNPWLALTLADFAKTDASFRTDFFRIGHDGAATVRQAYQLEGEVYESLAARVLAEDGYEDSYYKEQAAVALDEAGWRLTDANEFSQAITLLRRAVELDPRLAEAHWDLADALRFESYTPVPIKKDEAGRAIWSMNYPMLEEARSIWQTGTDVRLPDKAFSSTYVVRALINEAMSSAPAYREELPSLWWEAIVYTWRAILMDEKEPIRWSQLANFFEKVGHRSLALWAALEALRLDAENDAALEVLIDLGEIDRARGFVGQIRSDDSPTAPRTSVGRVLLRAGRLSEAVSLANRALADNPNDLSWLSIRSGGYELQGDIDAAVNEDRNIWSHYSDSNVAHALTFAWTAFALGTFSRAIELFERELPFSPMETHDCLMGIGLSQLGLGELSAGEQTLERALAASRNLRQVNDVLLFDLPLARRLLAGSMHEVGSILEKVEREARALIPKFETTSDPGSEIRPAFTSLLPEDNSCSAIGTRLTMAWLHREAGEWDEAAAIYRKLIGLDGDLECQVPEAELGLLNALREIAGRSFDERQIGSTVDRLRSEVESSRSSHYRVELHRLIAELEWKRGKLRQAFEHLARAETYRERYWWYSGERDEEDWRSVMERFTSEVSAPLPDSWITQETFTLSHPERKANVIVTVEPTDMLDSEEYAASHGELLRQQFNKYEEIEFTSVEWLDGRSAYRRQFRWEPEDSVPVTQIQLYFAEYGQAYIATATTTTADFEQLKHDLMLVLTGIQLREPSDTSFILEDDVPADQGQ